MSAALFAPHDDDARLYVPLPSDEEATACNSSVPPGHPSPGAPARAQRGRTGETPELHAEPVYLPAAETPARSRPLKRPPPTLGRIAPLPDIARTRTAGQWVRRYSALTTASDLRLVLQVGINVLLELRQEQRRAAPIGGLEHLASARLLKPLWSQPALREQTAGVLAVLEQEIVELVEALELVPLVQRGPGWELLEAARGRAISAHGERLEEIVAVLRQQVRQRGAVRRLAATLAGLAWKALVTLAA